MLYTFTCDKEKNGCGHIFEKVMSVKTYKVPKTCPKCKKKNKVVRDYRADLPQGQVKLSDTEIKVGHLAHRNTERMSNDEKTHLNYQHNKHIVDRQKNRREPPKGFEYLPRDETGKIKYVPPK